MATIAADSDGTKPGEGVVEREGETSSVGKRGAILGDVVAMYFCKPN